MCHVSVEAYILIGGKSSRLGRDKAFIEFDGVSLAERALNTVRESGIAPKITFVAGNATQFAIQAISLNAPFIFDLVEDRGPLGGLHAALSYARSEWIFVLACDYPFVSPDLLKLLANAVTDDFGAVVLEQPDGRIQPLCAFYKVKAALPIFDKIINAKRVLPPMREIANSLTPKIVTHADYQHLGGSERFFTNLNTPDDLTGIRKLTAD